MVTKLGIAPTARIVALALTLNLIWTGLDHGSLLTAAEEKKDSAIFTEKMKKWQNEMTEKFRDAWKGLRDKKGEPAAVAASVDLREQKDSYTVRLSLPERNLSKVAITLDGDELQITAPAEGELGSYKQTISLTEAAPGAAPQIERKQKDNVIVVTVPKRASLADADSPTLPDPSVLPGFSAWDSDIFARMDKMRREMDRVFEESFRNFRKLPEYEGFFDRPRFGSSLDLKEESDNYVVRAYLPDRDMENVNVTLENDDVLKIEAKAEVKEKKEDQGVVQSHLAQYAQVVKLPGPVQGDKMKVEKKKGMIVVTLPRQK